MHQVQKLSDKSLSKYLFVRNSALSENLSGRKFCVECACVVEKSGIKCSLDSTIVDSFDDIKV